VSAGDGNVYVGAGAVPNPESGGMGSFELTPDTNTTIDPDWVYLGPQTKSACPNTFLSSPMHICGDSISLFVSVRVNIKGEASVRFRIRKRGFASVH